MEKTIYTVHEDKKQLHVKREFNAPVDLVWRAWTEAKYLEQWWAPKPLNIETLHMDFREGGYWFYTMYVQESEKNFGKVNYNSITIHTNYKATNAFCDENGNENTGLPSRDWNVNFVAENSKTTVSIDISFPSNEAIHEIIKMGFKEGFAMAHDNLDELLKQMQQG